MGKTLTAEVIAEYTKKPLYTINIGELISEINIVSKLQWHFSTASRWDAVLLIDEADVLLEKRSYEDFKRNGIVSGISTCFAEEDSGLALANVQFSYECWNTMTACCSLQRIES